MFHDADMTVTVASIDDLQRHVLEYVREREVPGGSGRFLYSSISRRRRSISSLNVSLSLPILGLL